MTRNEICQLIQRRLAGGEPSDDFPVTLLEINFWLDHAVAASAKVNYTDGVNTDGIEFVGDAYYVTFKNLVLAIDPGTTYFTTTLPSAPIALPRGYDIADAYIQVGDSGLNQMVRVTPQQLGVYESLPKPKSKVFFWTEGKALFIQGLPAVNYTGNFVTIRMVGSAGKRLLTDELYIPTDYIPYIVEYIQKNFLPTQAGPKDVMPDGNDVR